MLLDLSGQVALVSGATGWLGKPISQALVHSGARVWLTARNQRRLDQLSQELSQGNSNVSYLPFDLEDDSAIGAALDIIWKRDGFLNVVINNGHPFTVPETSERVSNAARIGGIADVYLRLALRSRSLLAEGSATVGNAAIVNIASMYGTVSPKPEVYLGDSVAPNPIEYGCGMAAVMQLTRRLAVDFASEGIRVNSVSPGPFPKSETQDEHPEFATRLAAQTALGRLGNPHEVAGPVVFLASTAASYVTGTNLAVDGGWTAL